MTDSEAHSNYFPMLKLTEAEKNKVEEEYDRREWKRISTKAKKEKKIAKIKIKRKQRRSNRLEIDQNMQSIYCSATRI
jgi:hypothetical protein